MYCAGAYTTPAAEVDQVLLVDDNSTNLQMLLQTLSGRGYKLLIAKNGESALNIAIKAKPSLVLLDIMMPGMDGYEVCKQLKNHPEVGNMGIIFLSALNETKDKVRGLAVGAVDYISKPFHAEEVIARVDTQLKIHQFERALSFKNRQLEEDKACILENMTEGVFGIDRSGCITFVNRAAAIMTGWSIVELSNVILINQMLKKCDEHENCSQHLSPIQIVLNKGVTKTVDNGVFCNCNGQSFPVSYSCTPIIKDGLVNGAVIVFKDISEKIRQEEVLKKAFDEIEKKNKRLTHVSKLTIMGEMAAGFAHEVTQPLTAVSNYAQAAKKMLENLYIDDAGLNDVMSKIIQQASRAGGIISRIRTFVKKPEHVLVCVNPNQLIRDTYKLAEVDAKNNSMEVHLQLGKNLPDVRVDPVQIQQVALNLIRNGMEAMRALDTNSIGVMVITEMFGSNFVKVSIIDRGYGLAEGAEEKLFTPFYTTKSDGMGIGLSVCHSIIQSHGGTLGFKRHPKGGAIFEFTMPVAEN